ncbi:MAG: hypothetical protein HKN07_12650, partial [Acidimicrobiia bacterium]|nr:hypothetical protein [Acidimicrobiia bacterium]
RVVVLGGPGAVADGVIAQLATCEVSGVDRLFGADRYATAAEIASATFAGPTTVYVATGTDFPDALAAGPAAAATNSPVLLVNSTYVPSATSAALASIDPDRIVVLGGEAAVSKSVETSLAASGAVVTRIAGSDRNSTAALISAHAFPDGADVAFVVDGGDFPDALAAGASAANRNGPVLLTNTDTVPAATLAELERLDVSEIVIVGGTAAVSATVATVLKSVAPVTRIAGSDRYATAAAASAFSFPPGADTIYVATGEDYPDALAGTAAAGANGGPVLLTQSGALSAAAQNEIERLTGSSCSGESTPIPPVGGEHPVGFLGCSNSVRAVRGIDEPGVLWSAGEGEHPYGGGDLAAWADLSDSRWDRFQEYLDSEGAPQWLWWQLCVKHSGGPDPSADEISQVGTILAEIKRRTPGTEIFVSPINDFDGVTCSRLGKYGVEAAEALSALLALDTSVSLGPVLSPLDETTVEPDGCHQNDLGMAMHGAELVAFFAGG